MAGGTIKLFKFNQKVCKLAGVHVPQANGNQCTLNSVQLNVIFCSLQFAMASLAFIWHDAISMSEYGATISTFITTITSLVDYLILIWKFEDILKFIEYCETFLETSELNGFSLRIIFHINALLSQQESSMHIRK